MTKVWQKVDKSVVKHTMSDSPEYMNTFIFFLDMDGVLNNPRVCVSRRIGDRSDDQNWIDPISVDLLNRWGDLVRHHGFKPYIVMSSTWRSGFDTADAMGMFFSVMDVRIPVFTQDFKTRHDSYMMGRDLRGYQVKDWLQSNPDITNWMIIDDDCDFLDEQLNRLVQTSSHDGILTEHFEHGRQIIDRICKQTQNSVQLEKETHKKPVMKKSVETIHFFLEDLGSYSRMLEGVIKYHLDTSSQEKHDLDEFVSGIIGAWDDEFPEPSKLYPPIKHVPILNEVHVEEELKGMAYRKQIEIIENKDGSREICKRRIGN